MLDLGSSFIASVERKPDALAFVDGSVRLTYAQAYETISSLIAGFDELGMMPGDHIVTVLQNRWEAALIHWACQFAGIVVTPINWRGKADEVDYGIENSEAKAVVSAPLLERFRKVLDGKVSEVRISKRLLDSPACLVVPQGGMESHVERLLRLRNADLPRALRILELNLEHPLIRGLGELCAKNPESGGIPDYIELVHDQALLAEGSPVEDPVALARRIAELGARVLELDQKQ